MKGADTGDGTLEDPLIVGIYDRQGTYIPYSRVLGQSKTRDNDSGYGRNAITDFTEPCAGDYFVAVAGFEGSTGAYTLSVTDITDTSTSIPVESVGESWFVEWVLDTADEGNDVDYLIGNLAPGLPATVPAHDPRNSRTNGTIRHQPARGMRAARFCSGLGSFRTGTTGWSSGSRRRPTADRRTWALSCFGDTCLITT